MHYIVDPDQFFGKHADYMMRVLLGADTDPMAEMMRARHAPANNRRSTRSRTAHAADAAPHCRADCRTAPIEPETPRVTGRTVVPLRGFEIG
jgi:hypothetical protein